jgi:hypothetical protein
VEVNGKVYPVEEYPSDPLGKPRIAVDEAANGGGRRPDWGDDHLDLMGPERHGYSYDERAGNDFEASQTMGVKPAHD